MFYSKEEKQARLQQAVEKQELYDYLTGQKEYSYVSNYADAPTDSQAVFSSIVDYVDANTSHPLWAEFEQAWLTMSNDEQYSWLAVYYLYEYISFFYKRKDPALEQAKTFATAIVANISKNQPYLQANKKWVGADYPNGLWDDVKRLINNTNQAFNLNLTL